MQTRRPLLGLIWMATLVAVVGGAPATAAQTSLRDLVLDEIEGYQLVESGPNGDVRMLDGWNQLPWRTSFQAGSSIVEISAFDYTDLSQAVQGHAAVADGMEATLRSSDAEFADDEVVIRDLHPDAAGVTRVTWVLDGVDFAHLGFYIEGTVGYLVSVVDADAATFDRILLAQLERSPGPRVTTPLADVGQLSENESGQGVGGGSVFAALVVIGTLAALAVWGTRMMRRHGGGRDRRRHGDLT